MSRKVYIYGLYDPRTNEIRYIGKTYNLIERFWAHVRNDSKENNRRKAAWVSELKSANLKPLLRVIEECDDTNWQEKERYWIRFYRDSGSKLLNIESGGGGVAVSIEWDDLKNKPRAKLTALDVKTIRSLYQGGSPKKEIAERFGVSHSTIDYIVRNKNWYDPNYTPNKRREFHILTEQDAVEIRKLHNGGMSRDELMVKFDSSANVIQEIISNKRFHDPSYVRRDGLWRKSSRFNEQEISEIKRLRNNLGYTIKKLCGIFSTDYKTMKFYADDKKPKKYGSRTRSHVQYVAE